jgi:hypothetical protein
MPTQDEPGYQSYMPKSSPLIPTEFVLRELDTLSGSIRIIPAQVSIILGFSKNQLVENQCVKNALPFVKEGGKTLYRVEDVRNFLKAKRIRTPIL